MSDFQDSAGSGDLGTDAIEQRAVTDWSVLRRNRREIGQMIGRPNLMLGFPGRWPTASPICELMQCGMRTGTPWPAL